MSIELELLLAKLKAERPMKMPRLKVAVRFPSGPLTPEELANASMAECKCGLVVTEYQYRSLALLDNQFYVWVCKKYPPEQFCIFAIDELRPMFSEIHRAITSMVSTGLSVNASLKEYFTPASVKARKDMSDGTLLDN